jgi:hypothetical protein
MVLVLPLLLPYQAQAQQDPQDIGNSDVVLVIDHSGSMEENDPGYLRLAAAKLFIDLADPGDRIGVVVMSDRAKTRRLTRKMQRVGGGQAALKASIESLRNEPMGEFTHMGTALNQAYDLLESTAGNANQRQFVVLLTDGLPTGDGQNELVAQAAARFQQRRYWKVFSIALAFKDQAGPTYLQEAIAAPTGAEVVVAQNADELLDKYLDVYARAGDDRYIDRVQVQPNTLAPLVTVREDQQPTQVSVVLLRGSVPGRINGLMAPGNLDLVKPFYQNTIYHTNEPEYELYHVPLRSAIGLVGNWQVNVAQPDIAPAKMIVLSRSRLRIQMPAPAPLRAEDDSSPRYTPIGRPLLLVAGVQNAKDGVWLTDMAPAARPLAPAESAWTTLTDNGRDYDIAGGDGRYTGLLPPFTSLGDHVLQMEAPQQREAPIHIRRDYIIRVAELPTMTLTLPPSATTLPIDAAFTGLIDLPGRADFQIEAITFPFAFVKRPDGVLDPLAIQPDGAGRFQFQYTPYWEGPYRISVAAEVRGIGPMGAIRYIDYTEAVVAVPAAVPVVVIGLTPEYSAAFAQGKKLLYDQQGVFQIPLVISSQSPQREIIAIQLDGSPGISIVPTNTLIIEPNQLRQHTITVRLNEAERPKQGQLAVSFMSPEQRVIVQGSRLDVPFKEKADMLIPLLLVSVALVAGIGYLYYRYHRRRRQTAPAPATLRRVS